MSNADSSKWKFVGGRLCLDFINSVGGRIEDNNGNAASVIIKDKLAGYDDLIDWGREIGVLTRDETKFLLGSMGKETNKTQDVFDRAVTFRETLYRIFEAVIDGVIPAEDDLNVLNQECKIAYGKRRIIRSENDFDWDFVKENNLDSMIWPVALSAADLLVSDQLPRLKQCPGENCGWLFLDTSKNGKRQWCDMKDCGNLAKVRRYREKQK